MMMTTNMSRGARLRPAVAAAALLFSAGCAGGLGTFLWGPPVTAQGVWAEARLAHSAGRKVASLRFWAQEEFLPGVAEIVYPELRGEWRAYHQLDWVDPYAWMVALRGRSRVSWEWDGYNTLTRRDGRSYTPAFGVPRDVHLRALMILLRPWEPDDPNRLDAALLAPTNGNHRLLLQQRESPQDRYVLEIDPRTWLVVAMDYTMKGLGVPGTFRDEYSDFRDVGQGVVLAHGVTESVVTPFGHMRFHQMRLWNVEAGVTPLAGIPREPRAP